MISGGGKGGQMTQEAFINTIVYGKPKLLTEVLVRIKFFEGKKFDEDGNVID